MTQIQQSWQILYIYRKSTTNCSHNLASIKSQMERASKQKEENSDKEEEEIFYSPNSMEEQNEETQSNNDEEKKKIDQLRDIVTKQDPACKVCSMLQTHTQSQGRINKY